MRLTTCWTAVVAMVIVPAMAGPARAAIIVYNQNNPPDTQNVTGVGNYGGFSVAFHDAALTTIYTPPDAAPAPGTIYLTGLGLRHGGTEGTQNVYLNVYGAQAPTSAHLDGALSGEVEAELPTQQYIPAQYNTRSELTITIPSGTRRIEKNFELE